MARYSTEYGAYEIDSYLGQPPFAHCHGLYIKPEHQGKKLGHELKQHQMTTLRELGYSFATCTVDGNNERQQKVLERAGWYPLKNAYNARVNGITQLWGWVVQ